MSEGLDEAVRQAAAPEEEDDPMGGLPAPAWANGGGGLVLGAHKHKALDELIQQAMRGQLPRERDLKPWEPDRLDERHLQVILLRSAGMPQGRIAEMVGMTQSWVSVVLNHPDAQYVLTRLVSYAADNVLDVKSRLAAVAGEMLEIAIDAARNSSDEKLRVRSAFEILALAGYTPKVKIESEQKTTTNVNVNVAHRLTSALRESSEIVGEPVVVVPAPASGSSASPDRAAYPGLLPPVEPPRGDSQGAEPQEKVA
jgi:predicted transcriptional regulator